MLEQVEEQRFGPLDVIDHQSQRHTPGERFNQASDREEQLLGRPGRGGADEAGEQRRDPIGVVEVDNESSDRRELLALAHRVVDLDNRSQQIRDRRERGGSGPLTAQLDDDGTLR